MPSIATPTTATPARIQRFHRFELYQYLQGDPEQQPGAGEWHHPEAEAVVARFADERAVETKRLLSPEMG